MADPIIDDQLPKAPTTTTQQDLTVAGQRKINLIWEVTQAGIALMITAAVIYTMITSKANEQVSNAFFLIIGFYFSRTNHQAIGGIGDKPSQSYEGR